MEIREGRLKYLLYQSASDYITAIENNNPTACIISKGKIFILQDLLEQEEIIDKYIAKSIVQDYLENL